MAVLSRSASRDLQRTLSPLTTITGLRPYRRNGFRVEAERSGDKLVIHNYGHGGCGVTLSWGTGQMAADLVPFGQVAVVGAGAVGLATARLLQERGHPVTIYAREVTPNTTSNAAGALWTPVTLAEPEHVTPEFRSQLCEASRFSHRRFESMIGERYGVRWLDTRWVSEKRVTYPWELECTPEFITSRMLFIEPDIYLAALLDDFRTAGGTLIVRDVHAFEELPEPVIVNCSGIGAKALTGDENLVPVKGQLEVMPPQPEIDFGWIHCDEDLYMLPRRDSIILGGSHRVGDWTLEPDAEDTRRILEGHRTAGYQPAGPPATSRR